MFSVVSVREFQLFVFKVGEVLFKCDISSKLTGIDISGFSPIQITQRKCKLHLCFGFIGRIGGCYLCKNCLISREFGTSNILTICCQIVHP